MQHVTKEDALSGFFVFLIALPLCMGISIASGFPPVAGILTAIVGGAICSFLGGSPLTIKGPAAGLIVIVLGAVTELGLDDPILGYKRCLAVCVVAAIVQIVLAIGRFGILAEMMPPSVIHGMLAAIGAIIISKQIHILLGVTPVSKHPMDLLIEIPHSIMEMNPEVFFVGFLSICVLFFLPKFNSLLTKKVPVQLYAILLAIPFYLIFDFADEHEYHLLSHTYRIGPNYLIHLPGNLLDAITFPDFSTITSFTSIKYIIMLALVGSIESLLTVNAVDAMDPQKRRSDLNKDLLATGVGNLLVAFIGGLPMISEIVRSKANIDNGAKSSWANVFHGLFLLIFVSFFQNFLHMIPLTVLAAMLVFTGFRLAAPSTFVHTYHLGKDQLFVFMATFLVTIYSDLLIGVGVGILLKVIQQAFMGAGFFRPFKTKVSLTKDNGVSVIDVDGPGVFLNYLKLKKVIDQAQKDDSPIHVNFKKSSVVDLTIQTKILSLKREIGEKRLFVTGLESHRSLSDHPQSTKILKKEDHLQN